MCVVVWSVRCLILLRIDMRMQWLGMRWFDGQ